MPRRRNWIWFFALLAVLTVTAISVQVWYNISQQLTPEQLEAAVARWKEKGPHDYEMEYTIRKMDDVETYAVQARKGKVISVTRNGQPVEERLYRYSEMPALFGFIEDFLRQDMADSQQGKRRTYATASFDPEDGHLLRYVRSVLSSRERVEIYVARFRRLPEA